MSERAQAAGWQAILDPLLNGHAYDTDEVPDPLPRIYAEIGVSQRFTDEGLRYCGTRTGLAWRLTTRVVGKTVDEVRWARERIHTLRDKRQTSLDSSPLRLESEDEIGEDEGYYSGLTVWTYTAPKGTA